MRGFTFTSKISVALCAVVGGFRKLNILLIFDLMKCNAILLVLLVVGGTLAETGVALMTRVEISGEQLLLES